MDCYSSKRKMRLVLLPDNVKCIRFGVLHNIRKGTYYHSVLLCYRSHFYERKKISVSDLFFLFSFHK